MSKTDNNHLECKSGRCKGKKIDIEVMEKEADKKKELLKNQKIVKK